MTLLCIASYFKGVEFIRECKRRGARVFLVTSEKLADEAWPGDSLEEIFYVPGEQAQWDMASLIKSVSYLARSHAIDRIVALDDYDLEKAEPLPNKPSL